MQSICAEIESNSHLVSLRKVCIAANIHHKQYISWAKQYNSLRLVSKNTAKIICNGQGSTLLPFKEDLLWFIFALREQGMGVTTTMVMLRAAFLARPFCKKSRQAQYHLARCFMTLQGFVYQMSAHESQKDPRENLSEALDFAKSVCMKMTQPCNHQDIIINMDRTPIPFTYN